MGAGEKVLKFNPMQCDLIGMHVRFFHSVQLPPWSDLGDTQGACPGTINGPELPYKIQLESSRPGPSSGISIALAPSSEQT